VRWPVLAVASYGLLCMVEVFWFGRHDDRRPSDAIVVMGAAQWNGKPSPVLGARLDHAVDLYRAHVAPLVVVTGGRLPADRFTEAGVSREYLLAHGVPAEAIVSEDQGRTSWQELQTVASMVRTRVGKARPSVVLVSDPYHERRIAGMAGELGLAPRPSPARKANEPLLPLHYGQEAVGVGFAHVFGYHNLVWLDRG
jgi:uncharacterized SAM-binding protein YcdF (DUF218 family)